MTGEFRPCAVIPTYDNPRTIRSVVERLRPFLPNIIVVDDGSAAEGRAAVEALARDGLAITTRHEVNGGKGAGVKTGLALAAKHGFTHALQVDADGQHNLEDVPKMIEAARASPTAVILGCPIFDSTVPKGRLAGRQITIFFTHLETGGRRIVDPMCGFRVYPLASAVGVSQRCGDRMDFDIEVAVRLVWSGVLVVNVPTKVRYVPAAEGGISHFRMFRDNAAISWVHTRLVTGAILRLFTWPVRALTS